MALTDRMSLCQRIKPAQHAVLDYSVAVAFFTMRMRYRNRHARRASTLAFLNGAFVLGISLITDSPGGVWPAISFRTHGMSDVGQAALAGRGPLLFGLAGEPEARSFYAQAASEIGVIAATDWDAPAASQRRGDSPVTLPPDPSGTGTIVARRMVSRRGH